MPLRFAVFLNKNIDKNYKIRTKLTIIETNMFEKSTKSHQI